MVNRRRRMSLRTMVRLTALLITLIGVINLALDVHQDAMIDGAAAAIFLVVGITVLVVLVPYRPTRLWWQRPF